MPTATVTSKGQITIPIEVREALNLKTGEKVIFFPGEDGEFIVRRVGSILEMAGCLAGLDVPKTDEEMNQFLADYAAELDEASKSHSKKVEADKVEDGEAA